MNKAYDVLTSLEKMQDLSFREFSIKLTKTQYDYIGIRVPRIKILAKEISKSAYIDEILSFQTTCYEYILLQGLVIAYSKKTIKEKLEYLKNYVLKIDDWAICDIVSCALKIKQKEFFDQCIEWTKSDKEFVCRFGIINLMSHFLDDEHIDNVIINLKQIDSSMYYIEMAIAWYIQRLYFKYQEKAEAMLLDDNISDTIKKKANQKIRDSKRERKGANYD